MTTSRALRVRALKILLIGAVTLVGGGLALASATSKHAVPAKKGDKDLGEYLSAECVTCHQKSGAFKGIPPIIGWPDEVFIEIMNAYKLKERENQVMQNIAVKLSDDEIAALAAYFGSLQSK